MNSHNPFNTGGSGCTNDFRSADQLVDRIIGDAYHVVKEVYLALGNLSYIYNYLQKYGLIITVDSEDAIKDIPLSIGKFARVYNKSESTGYYFTDYLYVADDTSGIKSNDPTATGSWISTKATGSNASFVRIWKYRAVADGETTIQLPTDIPIIAVQTIYVQGIRQDLDEGFTYNADDSSITLADELDAGNLVTVIIGITDPDLDVDILSVLSQDDAAGRIGTESGKSVQEELNSKFHFSGTFEQGTTLLSNLDHISDGTHFYYWTGSYPKVVPPASTVESTGGLTLGNWALVTEQLIRDKLTTLGDGKGAFAIPLSLGGTLGDLVDRFIDVRQLGAKGDYDEVTKTGTDDTLAFRMAIAVAITTGIRRVHAGGGKYLITDELNLGGVNFVSGEGTRDYWRGITEGAALTGDGPYSTILVFDPPSIDTPCVSARGGWGTHSPRAVTGLAIEPKNWIDYSEKAVGTGVLLQGCCFVPVTDVHIGRFHRGLHLWNKLQGANDTDNTFTQGDFTEFNRMTRVRFFNSDIDIDYQVSLGNNSFHGNSFTDCMGQINSYGGIGMRMWDDGSRNAIRPSSLPYEYIANVYNNKHEINWFGSDARTCYLIYIDKAQGRGCNGDMTVEAAVTLKVVGQYWYQSFGSLHSISAINTVVDGNTDTATRPVAFMWMNSAYPQVNFDGTDPLLTSNLTPRQYDLTNFGNTGMELLNIRGTSTGAIWSIQNGAALGWILGRRAQADSRKGTRSVWQFSYNGEVIKSVASANVGIQNQTGAGVGMLGDVLFRPYTTGTVSLGSPTYSFTRLRTTDWNIDTFGIVPVQDGIKNAGSASNRLGTIFAATGTINTSDARLKTDVRPMSEAEIAAASDLSSEIGFFRWVNSVDNKGEDAREHCGLTVQRAMEVMRQHGLDPFNYGFICYDAWDEQVELNDETGEVLRTIPAGDRYSFRFDQLTLFIARGMEERIKLLENK